MQTKIPALLCTLLLLSACGGQETAARKPTAYVGVMIDNHEDARPWQRGLEGAPLVQEFLVEGFITRFMAWFPLDGLPASVGPVRSVRPYFVHGGRPLVSAIFHVGGSPEALEELEAAGLPASVNGIYHDDRFLYDDQAPAPHDRFVTAEELRALTAENAGSGALVMDPFPYGPAASGTAATVIDIGYFSPLHDVRYAYGTGGTYWKRSGGEARPPSPGNVVILETDVEVIGPLGRLAVRTQGSGAALLFRDGTVTRATWSKAGDDGFYVLRDGAGADLRYANGQIWMIVLDSLDRVTWTGSTLP